MYFLAPGRWNLAFYLCFKTESSGWEESRTIGIIVSVDEWTGEPKRRAQKATGNRLNLMSSEKSLYNVVSHFKT